MEYLLALGVFLLFAFWVNHGIKMTGLYGDDLYLWYCFDTESLREFILPLGGTKFRLIHNILCYLQLLFMGPDIWLMIPFNIVVNALIAPEPWPSRRLPSWPSPEPASERRPRGPWPRPDPGR